MIQFLLWIIQYFLGMSSKFVLNHSANTLIYLETEVCALHGLWLSPNGVGGFRKDSVNAAFADIAERKDELLKEKKFCHQAGFSLFISRCPLLFSPAPSKRPPEKEKPGSGLVKPLIQTSPSACLVLEHNTCCSVLPPRWKKGLAWIPFRR